MRKVSIFFIDSMNMKLREYLENFLKLRKLLKLYMIMLKYKN